MAVDWPVRAVHWEENSCTNVEFGGWAKHLTPLGLAGNVKDLTM